MQIQHFRKSPRLSTHDYRTCAIYQVTVSSRNKQCIFGEIDLDIVQLSPLGILVDSTWRKLSEQNPMAGIHALVVMPNHVHALIELKSNDSDLCTRSLSTIVSSVKAECSRTWHSKTGSSDPIWHRSYHDVLIKSEAHYRRALQYIADNPIKWHLDRFNPNWRG